MILAVNVPATFECCLLNSPSPFCARDLSRKNTDVSTLLPTIYKYRVKKHGQNRTVFTAWTSDYIYQKLFNGVYYEWLEGYVGITIILLYHNNREFLFSREYVLLLMFPAFRTSFVGRYFISTRPVLCSSCSSPTMFTACLVIQC